MTDAHSLYETLADTAKGDWGREAAVDLLHRHGRWLATLDHHGYVAWSTEEDGNDDTYASIKWAAVAGAFTYPWEDQTPPTDAASALLVGSGSEQGILRLACSIGGGSVVSVRESFSSLDARNAKLALHAIAHAARGRAYAEQAVPLTRSGDPHACADCGQRGEAKPWHPRGDTSKVLVVCMDCGNSWIIPADQEEQA